MALSAVGLSLVTHVSDAQVGIGTTLPQAMLHVHDGSILGTSKNMDPQKNPFYDPSNPEFVEYGIKWFHDKGASRMSGSFC